jgi:purine-nucleoside phosphorylase
MQTLLRRSGLALFGLVAFFFIWFGVTYATVSDMLWFHEAAVPQSARAAVRPLYFALMNLIGGASVAVGVLSLYVIAMPLRRGEGGAASMLVTVNAIVLAMAAVTAEELAAATGSPTSWHIMGAIMAVTLVAFVLHNLARTARGA